jgi:hypothetical protein
VRTSLLLISSEKHAAQHPENLRQKLFELQISGARKERLAEKFCSAIRAK